MRFTPMRDMADEAFTPGSGAAKVFFETGDKVRLKQFAQPEMIVRAVLKIRDPDQGKSQLLGISCMWFTTQGEYQEQTFSTKDLLKVRGVRDVDSLTSE